MPQTINGIGTAYLWAKNKHSEMGICESCHSRQALLSYDTGHWITVLYLPIIPLGRKQIINYCPACTRHRSIPLAEWNKVKQEALTTQVAEMANNSDDPRAAMRLHATYSGFGQQEEAKQLAEIMKSSFGSNAEVQFYLAAWHERIGQGAQAGACFAKALELEPDNAVYQRAVAMGMIEQGKLPEARALLTKFEHPSPNYEPGVFILLADAYQKRHDHAAANQVHQLLLAATPALGKNKGFRQSVRTSEKALGQSTSKVKPDSFLFTKTFAWSMAGLAVVAALLAANFYQSRHRKLQVVNSMPSNLTITIDNQPIQLGAGQRLPFPIAEGAHEVSITSPAHLAAASEPFTVQSNFWTRLFRSPVFVLDPAKSGGVMWEEMVYSEHPSPDDYNSEYQVAQLLYSFPHIDYAFADFPTQLKIDSSRVTKTRVDMVREPPAVMVMAIAQQVSMPEAQRVAENYLRAAPDDSELAKTYVAVSVAGKEPLRCLEFFSANLNDEVLHGDWHRYYQRLAPLFDPQVNLLEKYDALLAKRPNDALAIYLRGRLEPTTSHANEYFSRAFQADPNNAFVLSAAAFSNLSSGNFSKALKLSNQALASMPNKLEISSARNDALFALKDFKKLELLIRQAIAEPGQTLFDEPWKELVLLYAAQGDRNSALQAITEYDLAQTQAGETRDRAKLNAILDYVDHNYESLEHGNSQPIPGPRPFPALQLAVLTGKLSQATELLDEEAADEDDGRIRLALYLAYYLAGDQAAADSHYAAAIAHYANGGEPSEGYAAEMLAAAQTADTSPEQMMDFTLHPLDKSLILTAMATRVEDRQNLIAMARKLNYKPEFPHHLINDTLDRLK